MIALKCASCGHELEVSEASAGRTVACPRCGKPVSAAASGKTERVSSPDTDTPSLSPTIGVPASTSMDRPPVPASSFEFLSPPEEADDIGRLANYRVKKLLGQGGMGMVFQATDIHLQRSVALKVMRPEMGKNLEFRQRFLREARATAAIKSDYIVMIHQVGQENDVPYLAMEFLEGTPLDRWIEKKGKPGIPETVRIAIEIARGLDAAHQRGLIHRDIKPANIWIEEPSGRVKILDFGLARAASEETRLTQTGLIMGTPEYMAPEQAEGADVDARCDLYSLGCVLYEMLTGNPPFTGPNVMSILKAVATEEPMPIRKLNADVPAELAEVIELLLAKKPEDRYQTAAEVVVDLESLGLASSGPTSGASRVQRASQARRMSPRGRAAARRRWLMVGGGLAAALACVLGGIFLFAPHIFSGGPPGTGVARVRPTFRGVTQDEILLGLSAPFSGPNKELGRDMEIGITTYLRFINDQGGISGRKIELVSLDDRYDPDRALANIKELFAQRKVFAVIGNVGTPTAEKALPYALDNDLIFFGAFTGAGLLRRTPPDAEVFNYRASYEEETSAIVKYLIANRRVKPSEIAVFSQDDGYGESGYRGAVKELRKHGGAPETVLKVTYPRNTTNVEPAVQELLKHPEIKAVVMVPTYKPAARFIQQVRDARPDMIFTNVSFVGSYALAEELMGLEAKGKYTDGVIVTQVVPLPESHALAVSKYRELLKKYNPSEQPTFTSLEGYIDAAIFCEGLRSAGDNLNTDTMIQALESIRNLDIGIGTTISYGPSDHQGSHKVWGSKLDKAGKYQILELDE